MKSITSLLNNIPNKKLLVTFPHPDDETVMASTLMQEAVSLGWEVKVIIVTNGVLGRIHVHGHGRSLIQIRRQELDRAMKLLGVTDWAYWRYCDGHLKEHQEWKEEIKQELDNFNPGLVLSYGPDGVSGHPDHLALGKYLYLDWKKQSKYQLLWPSFTGVTLEYLKDKTTTADRIVSPTYVHKGSNSQVKAKIQALHAHESQDLKTVLEWMESDPAEHFAVPDKKTTYDFSYVEFDLGN